jgi:phosphomannomutase
VEDIEALRDARLIIDVAHGAFAPFAREETAGLGLRANVINDDVTGENINRESGVAWLEGKGRIAGSEVDAEIAIVREVRSLARESRESVFGIALDGDGDRAFVLVYDAEADEVRVVDGDRVAFLLARLAQRTQETKGRVFAGTVESDLALFDAVRRLGIETVITPVGDKWLSARSELSARLLVGEEPSGHLVLPVDVSVTGGRRRTLFTGNGLVTGLRGAAACLRLKLTPAEAAEPFKSGVVRTFYTYFVDRARFHRDSPVWRKDAEIARAALARLKSKGRMPGSSELRPVDFEDDPDMLYLSVEEGSEVLGAVFARNSGTENKTATYARGRAEYEAPLVAMAQEINGNHDRTMKDESIPEACAARALSAALSKTRRLTMAEARRIAAEHGVGHDAGFTALLFALAREGEIQRVGDEIQKHIRVLEKS